MAFLTRSILLLAARALKYNKLYLWLRSLAPGVYCLRYIWKRHPGDSFIKHEKHQFWLLYPASKMSFWELFIDIQQHL